MSIRERPEGSGRWEVRVYAGRDPGTGRDRQVSRVVHGTQKAAQRLEGKLAREVADADAPPSSTTVSQLLDRWMAHLESRGRSPWTMRGYRGYIAREIVPAVGARKVQELEARHLDALYDRLLERSLAPATVRQVHAILSAALGQAEKWGIVARDVSRLASPPTVRRAPRLAPTPEQVRKLVAIAERRDPVLAGLVLTAALTGARRGELCALRRSDLDVERRELRIHAAVFDGAGPLVVKDTKNHQERTIAVDEVTIGVVLRCCELARARSASTPLGDLVDDPYVFGPSPLGDVPPRPGRATKFLRAVADEAGLPDFHLHDLRHFSVTMALNAGIPLPTVSRRHGHSSTQTTATVYAHAVGSTDRVAAVAIGQLLVPQATA